MFFGMTNSLATFQTIMNNIFQDLIAEGIIVVYLDDILIFTRTEEEHAKAIRWVLQVLQEHKLFLHLEKCEFCKKRIEYLGLVISENEVSMDLVKVAGIREWPTPENKTDVQAFLDFVNFYRRFIRDFSAKARPLFDLTCSEQVWTWSGREQTAFEDLKMAVTTALVLMSPQDSGTMGKPDALLRRANHGNGALDNENIVLLRPEFLAVRALEGVELTGVEQKILSDICKGNRNGDQEEPIAKAARELRNSTNKAVHSSEWSNVDSLLRFQGKIYVPRSPDLRRQIVALCHDIQIAGHPGHWKTLELVSQNYWWPQMSRYISQYVSTCNLCLRMKPWRHSPVSELQPLSVLDAQ